MVKNDQEEAFERVLVASLARVVDFVKFGEAKNAALLTFNSAWIIASITMVHGASPIKDKLWIWAMQLALPMFAISAVDGLIAFFPKIKLDGFHRDPKREKSLLFFGDICEFSPESYRDRVRERYMPSDGSSATKHYLDDLSIQINVNAAIAVGKFQMFKLSAILTGIGLLVLAITGIRQSASFIMSGG